MSEIKTRVFPRPFEVALATSLIMPLVDLVLDYEAAPLPTTKYSRAMRELLKATRHIRNGLEIVMASPDPGLKGVNKLTYHADTAYASISRWCVRSAVTLITADELCALASGRGVNLYGVPIDVKLEFYKRMRPVVCIDRHINGCATSKRIRLS
jgi:hypothetical protein